MPRLLASTLDRAGRELVRLANQLRDDAPEQWLPIVQSTIHQVAVVSEATAAFLTRLRRDPSR